MSKDATIITIIMVVLVIGLPLSALIEGYFDERKKRKIEELHNKDGFK